MMLKSVITAVQQQHFWSGSTHHSRSIVTHAVYRIVLRQLLLYLSRSREDKDDDGYWSVFGGIPHTTIRRKWTRGIYEVKNTVAAEMIMIHDIMYQIQMKIIPKNYSWFPLFCHLVTPTRNLHLLDFFLTTFYDACHTIYFIFLDHFFISNKRAVPNKLGCNVLCDIDQ